MADNRLRDLGTIVPGARLAEASAPTLSAPPPSRGIEPETVSPADLVFAADLPDGIDALGLDAPLGLLAELSIRTYHESQGKPTYLIAARDNVAGPARRATDPR